MSRGGTTLYVTGFREGTRARDLAYEFERYGNLVRCDIPAPRASTSRTFAFVEYESRRDADDAHREMHNFAFSRDETLKVEWARTPPSVIWRVGAPDGRSSRRDRSPRRRSDSPPPRRRYDDDRDRFRDRDRVRDRDRERDRDRDYDRRDVRRDRDRDRARSGSPDLRDSRDLDMKEADADIKERDGEGRHREGREERDRDRDRKDDDRDDRGRYQEQERENGTNGDKTDHQDEPDAGNNDLDIAE